MNQTNLQTELKKLIQVKYNELDGRVWCVYAHRQRASERAVSKYFLELQIFHWHAKREYVCLSGECELRR